MIKLGTVIKKDVAYLETIFRCPKCGTSIFFFNKNPEFCKKCRIVLPELSKLKSNIDVRVAWHKDG